ncbi:MAG TPA: AAA family ATPase [Desulfobacteraceae bacterium]|nr:AAA family ATPase [Desulfobacteraceae bacterium]
MPNHIKSVTLLQEKFPTVKSYPFNLEIFNKTKHLTFDAPITMFVGENGTGKSTLLEAMTRACGIHIWEKYEGRRYQFNRYEKELYRCLKIEWADGTVPGAFFGSEIFKDFANIVDEWAASDPAQLKYFGGGSLVTQSHGQSMMSYFRARYKRKGLYLLDEPETALSPRSQLEFLDIIKENSRAGHAQFIISTHSPILLSCDGAVIYSFDYSPPRVLQYEDTDHYQIYKGLLA